MEYAPDGGRAWREHMRAWILKNLNHHVYDPTEEARRILSEEEQQNLAAWKTSDLDRYRRIMRFIINHDLDMMTDRTDYVVCYWDEAAQRGAGTKAELTAAYRRGVPVYFVTEMPIPEISGWVLGCLDRIFSNFDDLKNFLLENYGRGPGQRELWDAE